MVHINTLQHEDIIQSCPYDSNAYAVMDTQL